MRKKGFTLLEMLVVIGIISILISLGIASYSTAQKKARDAKRKGDIRAILNAVEQYYSICNYAYPPNRTSGQTIQCAGYPVIMTIPTDPKGAVYTFDNATGRVCTAANAMEAEMPLQYCVNTQQ